MDDTGEVSELLRELIRNACVNDGRVESGEETRNADTLSAYLDGAGFDVTRLEPQPGRTSLVARLPGTDADAPSLCLMGHIDVVPADADRWSHDPFAADTVDDVVFGRGAVDMLNQTAAQAVAARRLAVDGFAPKGDLVLFFPADEEAAGVWGAKWILEHDPDVVRCDYLLTEGGGFLMPGTDAPGATPAIGVSVAEKGPFWRTLKVRGTAGHASIPWGSDNATATAGEVIVRLARYVPPAEIGDVWRGLVETLALPDATKAALVDASTIDAALVEMRETRPHEARVFHSCTHTTFAPTVVHGGVKTNVIAPSAEITLDSRVLPGQDDADLTALLRDALGDLFDAVTVEEIATDPASASPVDSPLWDVLADATQAVLGPSCLAPWLAPFATDARFFRRHGTVAYGFTLHDRSLDLAAWLGLFHGDDERVSLEALSNAVDVYDGVVRRFLA